MLRCLGADREPDLLTNRVAIMDLRQDGPVREAEFRVGQRRLRLAVVHSLSQARRIAELVRTGDVRWDIVEIMACPGRCVNGAGQPASIAAGRGEHRARALRDLDTFLDFHRPQENPEVDQLCREMAAGGIPSPAANCCTLTTRPGNGTGVSARRFAIRRIRWRG